MATPIESAKSVEIGGSTAAFKTADDCAQIGNGRKSQKKVDVVRFAAKPGNSATNAISNGSKNLAKNRKVSKNLPRELRAKDDVPTKTVDTVTCCIRVKVANSLRPVLDAWVPKARVCVDRMLAHRDQSSSKFFHEVPCVISKSLIAKYQRNKKCKSVTNLVLPICDDKGKQSKLEASGLRIPALFKKEILPVIWLRLPVGFIRSAEFFMRHGGWYAAICYNAKADKQFICTGTVGVDRNSVGAVATLADPPSGKVLHLDFNPAKTKEVWRGQSQFAKSWEEASPSQDS